MTADKTEEAVARAIDPALWDMLDKRTVLKLPLGVDLRGCKAHSLARASLAIKAHTECLMKPSPEMCYAGGNLFSRPFRSKQEHGENARNCFRAMLLAQENP